MSSVTQKTADRAQDRPSARKVERASVRKLPNGGASNGHDGAERSSSRKLPAERASARKMERASKPDVHERESKSHLSNGHASNGHIKKERASKTDVAAAATVEAAPEKPVRKSWRKELFRAMVDALRDILRYERRTS